MLCDKSIVNSLLVNISREKQSIINFNLTVLFIFKIKICISPWKQTRYIIYSTEVNKLIDINKNPFDMIWQADLGYCWLHIHFVHHIRFFSLVIHLVAIITLKKQHKTEIIIFITDKHALKKGSNFYSSWICNPWLWQIR